MNAVELFIAQGTNDHMRKAAQAIPPYDLLKAYREAQAAFNTTDIVLALSESAPEDFTAMPRSAYIEQAFRRWSPAQRKIHPLAKESAHKKLKVPSDTPAWWLVIESPDSHAIGFCAIGAFNHVTVAAN
jgi:hypothetical protein